MILGTAADQTVDQIAISLRPAQRLEQNHCHPFTATVPVGSLIERLATSILAQHPSPAGADGDCRAGDDIDTSHYGRLAFTIAYAPNRPMQRHERTRAGGVDSLAGSMQVQ